MVRVTACDDHALISTFGAELDTAVGTPALVGASFTVEGRNRRVRWAGAIPLLVCVHTLTRR